MGLFGKRKSRATRRAEARAIKARAKLEAKLSAKNEARRIKAAQRGIKGAQGAAEGPAGQRPGGAQGRRSRAQGSTRRQVAVTDADSPVADGFSAPGPDTDAGDIPGRDGCPRVDRPAARRSARGPAGTDRPVLRSWRPVVGAGWGAERSLRMVQEKKPKDVETKQFVSAVTNRLTDLSAAVAAAEHMPAKRRRTAHSAISSQLDGIEADLMARLGLT